VTVPLAGFITAGLGTLLAYPALRMRGHYVSIATLGIGEIVGLVILNWTSLTHGAMGLTALPPPEIAGFELTSVESLYWMSLALVVVLGALQARLLSSHLGRAWRAIREDEVAARSYGVDANRHKAMAFAFGGFGAGIGGALTAHLYSYIDYGTFSPQLSILTLTMVILGGLGNILGAVLGSVLLIGLPELFRFLAEYRMLIYGVVLLLLIRYRPQGLLGTV
jgi:branched-chain amino acid transport system permease protein